MESYTFRWEHDANEAFVTGTFDNWRKSVRLDKKNGVFQKTVQLDEDASDKIYYKFVVDHNWTVNSSFPHEADRDGNINNYLTRADLVATSLVSSVSPDSSTAAMAGKKNKAKKAAAKQQPSATPSAEPLAGSSADAQASSSPAKPKDAAATPTIGPGGYPHTPASEDDKSIGINPMPAAAGVVNPVKLVPGEPIPASVSAGGVGEHLKLDKESYQKSDALPGTNLQSQVPPVTKNMIPESSLPMGDAHQAIISSVGPSATTTALAGAVPRENAVPEIVKKSQDKAGFAPEASAVPEEVREKSKLERELQDKVQRAPETSEGTTSSGTDKMEHKGHVDGATAAKHHSASVKTADSAKDLNDSAKQNMSELGEVKDSAKSPASLSAIDKQPVASELAKEAKQAPVVDERTSRKAAAHYSRSDIKPVTSKSHDTPAAGGAGHGSTPGVAEPAKNQASELPTHEIGSQAKLDVLERAEPAVVRPAPEVDKPAESALADSKAPDSTPEATRLTESEAADSTLAAAKPQETSADVAGATNGSGTKAASSSAEATPEKKNRLSTMFTRLKEKLADRR